MPFVLRFPLPQTPNNNNVNKLHDTAVSFEMSAPPPKPPKPPPKPPKPAKSNVILSKIEDEQHGNDSSQSSLDIISDSSTSPKSQPEVSKTSSTSSKKVSIKIDEALKESMQALSKTVFSGR
jgi:hypothetical protein